MTTTYLGGRMSDRLGRRTMIICGWITYALVYLGFGLVESQTGLIVVFLSYGVFFGFTEPAEKAWVADLARPDQRGAAFGAYHGVVGLAAMPASIIFGLIWKTWGPEAAFFTGAALAAAAAVPLFMIRTTRTAG
jgi:predicted MFS family arabinose efflux permease